MRYLLISAAVITLVAACDNEPTTELLENDPLSSQAPTGTIDNPNTVDQPVDNPAGNERASVPPSHGELGSSIPVDLVAGDDVEYFVRSRRRMNLDQLQAQIAHATGGRQWIANNKNQFEALAATLGRPDYISTLFEDLSAGPVFQKFLGDAARSICAGMADDEIELPPGERILMASVTPEDTVESNPEAVDANLVQLMLRFHGLSVPSEAPVLAKYRWLFQSVTHTTKNAADGWRIVCIALMSHPRFYSY